MEAPNDPHAANPITQTEEVENGSSVLRYIFFGIAIILIALMVYFESIGGRKRHRDSKNSITTINAGSSNYYYEETYTLKKGEPATEIKIPIGFGCQYSNPGKEFCRQTENNPVDTIGGDKRPYKRQSEYTRKVWLSALNDDVSITVFFKKLN